MKKQDKKKYIIFFRSEKKFVEPRLGQFPFPEKEIELTIVDIGDDYETIRMNKDKIIEAIDIIQGYTDTIYLCGAYPNGFTWLLHKLLDKHFSLNFVWLQMARQKEKAYNLKQYEIWMDF